MTELQLDEDEYRLFCAVPHDGAAAGNGSLRSTVGWSKARYGRARAGLLAKQLVIRGVGRGGTLRRSLGADSQADSPGTMVSIPAPVTEPSLYDPLVEMLGTEWSENRGMRILAAEIVAFGGSRQTGGRWSRPDLVAVGIRNFELVPPHFEVVTFEVKTVDHINVLAVYEALSHSRSATHAYAIFQVPDVLAETKADEVEVVIAAASDHGIGVVTFSDPADFETWDERQPAERLQSDPVRINTFLQEQLALENQKIVAASVRSLHPDFL